MKQCTAALLLAVGVALLLTANLGGATSPSCWHHPWPRPPPKFGTAMPLEDCQTSADCCGRQECRTYSAFKNLGDHADYPDMKVVGHKRCVPVSFKHASPSADDIYLAPAPNDPLSIAAITAKYPGFPNFDKWKCSEGDYSDWYVPHFCCISDWMKDLFPPCNGEPFCWNNDVVPSALQACRKIAPYPGFIRNKSGCCVAPGGISAQDIHTDETTGSRCLIGVVTQAPAPGSDEASWGPSKECCPDTCNYKNPVETALWMCVKASDLGYAVAHNGRWFADTPNACNLEMARKDGKVAADCARAA